MTDCTTRSWRPDDLGGRDWRRWTVQHASVVESRDSPCNARRLRRRVPAPWPRQPQPGVAFALSCFVGVRSKSALVRCQLSALVSQLFHTGGQPKQSHRPPARTRVCVHTRTAASMGAMAWLVSRKQIGRHWDGVAIHLGRDISTTSILTCKERDKTWSLDAMRLARSLVVHKTVSSSSPAALGRRQRLGRV